MVYPVELVQDGKTVPRLSIGAALVRTAIPSVVKRIPDEHVFISSAVGLSVQLKTVRAEEEIQSKVMEMEGPAAVADTEQDDLMDNEGEWPPSFICSLA